MAYQYSRICDNGVCLNRVTPTIRYCDPCKELKPELIKIELEWQRNMAYSAQYKFKKTAKKAAKLSAIQARKIQQEVECIEVDFSE